MDQEKKLLSQTNDSDKLTEMSKGNASKNSKISL